MVKSKNGKSGKNVLFRPKEKILKYLLENKEPVSIREASNSTGIDYKSAYGYVGDLTASGSITYKVFGRSKPIEINFVSNEEIYSVEKKRTEEFSSKHPKFKLIKQDIEEINYPFMIVLVFGSYVKNKETRSSDIDICIISDNKEKTNKLLNRLNLSSLKLEIQEFSTKEFISMIEKNQRNLGHEIIKSNIILYGIENYYNLVSKWMKTE